MMLTTLPVIAEDIVERSIAWAEHELYLREELWPVDKGNLVERMEQAMRRALKKHEALTKKQLMDASNVHRAGSGGMETFDRAFKAMLRHCLVVLGKRTKEPRNLGWMNNRIAVESLSRVDSGRCLLDSTI